MTEDLGADTVPLAPLPVQPHDVAWPSADGTWPLGETPKPARARLAELLIRSLAGVVEQNFMALHGSVRGRETAILALGKVAHDSVCDTLGLRKALHPFKHGVAYTLPATMAGFNPAIHGENKLDGRVKPAHGGRELVLISSYHCSRYNTNTGVLTTAMFEKVVAQAKKAAGI